MVDVKALLRNKWALAGVGVAAVAGLVVLYRRKAATGSTSSTGAQKSPGYTAGGVGSFDSTGTDVAAWMGNYSANLQHQLDEFRRQVTDSLAGAAAVQPAPTAPQQPGKWIPRPTTAPQPTPAPRQKRV